MILRCSFPLSDQDIDVMMGKFQSVAGRTKAIMLGAFSADLVELSIEVGPDGSTNVKVLEGEYHVSRPAANEVHCQCVFTA
jgi:hypothetical protein